MRSFNAFCDRNNNSSCQNDPIYYDIFCQNYVPFCWWEHVLCVSVYDAGKQLLIMFCCLAHKKELVSKMHVRNHPRPSCSYIFIMSEHMTRAWLDVCSYPSRSNVEKQGKKGDTWPKSSTKNNFPRYKKDNNHHHLNDLLDVSQFLLHIYSLYISYNCCKLLLWDSH
jgi:hypothetical protein